MKSNSIQWIKLIAALVGISLLVALAAKDVVPQTPLWLVLIYALGGAIIVALVIVAVMWFKFAINQYFLNAGATDTQWLWFKSDPHGISEIRRRAANLSAQSDDAK